MLFARVKGEGTQPDEIIPADAHPKKFYRDLINAGRLCCPDPHCDAKLLHVSAVADAKDPLREKFACTAIRADGDTSLRVPHFRSEGIETHAAGCDYRNDPHMAENITSFKKALDDGLPIKVNVNFLVGFTSLSHVFNASVASGENGLWDTVSWEKDHKGFVLAPARDITDVLHYLTIAKEKKALKQLYFSHHRMVQSCNRFIVRDVQERVAAVTQDIFDRARASRKNNQHYHDTPRLFLFEASQAQKDKARVERDSDLWGQKFFVNGGINHEVKLGLDSTTHHLTNQTMLDKGDTLWVVATPKLHKKQLVALYHKNKFKSDPVKYAGSKELALKKPLFLTLTLESRAALGMVGTENKMPLHSEATLAPEFKRQLDIFDDTATPVRKPAKRKAKVRAAAATRPTETRRSPRHP